MANYYNSQHIADHARTELPCKYTDVFAKAEVYQKLVIKELAYGYFLASMDQINNNQLPFNITRLRKELGRYGKPQKYWWDWLHQNYPLIKIIKTGNSIQGVSSMATTDIPLEIIMASANGKELVDALYSKFDSNSDIHLAPVNLQNLNNYILATTAENNPNPTIQNNLKTARIIYLVAKHFYEETGQAVIPQVVNYSNFGRVYYKGLNLQNVHKTVREAALGPCYSVDINSAVFNWKYAVVPFRQELTYTRELIQDKTRIRKHLAQVSFGNTNSYTIKTIKQVLTAISFGAKSETRCWYKNEQNQWTQGAISEIIKSKQIRDTLFKDQWMVEFMREQDRMNDYIARDLTQAVKEGAIEERYLKDLQTERGRTSKTKLIAWAYQQTEQQVMQELIKFSRAEVLLQVHDGVYFKTKPDMPSMQTVLQEKWPLATLSIETVDQYLYNDLTQDQEHRDFIRKQERLANNGADPITTGIHNERIAVKQYDCHSEPDWETEMQKQYNELFDDGMPEFVRQLLSRKPTPI